MRKTIFILCALAAPGELAWGQSSWPGYPSNNTISVTSGNVGIGTGAPGLPLTVMGQTGGPVTTGTTQTGIARFTQPGTGTLDLGYSNYGAWLQVTNSTNLSLVSNLLLNPSGGYVGVGTTNPDQRLTVQGGVAIRDNTGANGGQTLYLANTTPTGTNYGAVIQAVGSGAANNTGGYFSASGATNNYGVRITGPSAGLGSWAIYADASASNYFAGNVGIGTISPQYPLSVNGTVQAKEVLVNTGWSDYVFAPTYRLQPLSEVAAYIKENQHLPDMPSAADVEKNGVGVGEMESKLLAKVEELTLHVIDLDQKNRELEQQNQQLQKLQDRMSQLEDRIGKHTGGQL